MDGLNRLNSLDLARNQIEKIQGLEGLPKLEDLNLRGNLINDIEALWELEGLTNLTLSGNPIFEQIKKHYKKIHTAYDEILNINDFLKALPDVLKKIKID